MDRLEDSIVYDDDDGWVEDDLPPVRVNRGIMTIERMNELLLRYRVPSDYIYRMSIASEYVFTSGRLEIGVY